ncbi:hypothetical protein CLOM_g13266 [Closterium sp. NIES-68]|nr:hypothetical protein CLOM_g13266 [Closterium sp. NIES-68]GJP57486.1 hypothetical protein CLOP_g12200 [Closterium sp. NIES-67]
MSIYASPYDASDDGGMPDELPRTISLERSFAALYGLQNTHQQPQPQQQQQRKFRGWPRMGSFFGSSNSNASTEASRRGSPAGSAAQAREAIPPPSLLRTVSLPNRAAALKAQQQQQQLQQQQQQPARRTVRSAEEEERERQRQIEEFGTPLADDVPPPPPGYEYGADLSPDSSCSPPLAVAAPPSPSDAAEGQEYAGEAGVGFDGGSSNWGGGQYEADGAAAGGGGPAEYRPRAVREFRRTTSSPVPKCPPASAPASAAGARDRRLPGSFGGATFNGPFSSGGGAGGAGGARSMGSGGSSIGSASGSRGDVEVRFGGGGLPAVSAIGGSAAPMGSPSRASAPFAAPPAASTKPPARAGFGRSTSVTQPQGNAGDPAAAGAAGGAGGGGGGGGGGRRAFRRAISMELRPRMRTNRPPLVLNPLDDSPRASSGAGAFPRPPVPWAAADDPCSPSAPLPAPHKQPHPSLPHANGPSRPPMPWLPADDPSPLSASSSPFGRPPSSGNPSARGWAAWTQADEASPRAAFAPPYFRSSSLGGPSSSSLRTRELPPPAPPHGAHLSAHAGAGAWGGAGGGGMGAAVGGGYEAASPGSQRSLSPDYAEQSKGSLGLVQEEREEAYGGGVREGVRGRGRNREEYGSGGRGSREPNGERRAVRGWMPERGGGRDRGGGRERYGGSDGRCRRDAESESGSESGSDSGSGSDSESGSGSESEGDMGGRRGHQAGGGGAWEGGRLEEAEESPREATMRCRGPSMHALLRRSSHSRHRSLDASSSSASPSCSPVPLARPVCRPGPPASVRSPARAGWGRAAGGADRVEGSPLREVGGGGGGEEGVTLVRASTLHESSSSSRRGGNSAWHADRQAEAGGNGSGDSAGAGSGVGSGHGGGGGVETGVREVRKGLVRSASGVEARHCRNRSAGGVMSIGATGSIGVAASMGAGAVESAQRLGAAAAAPPPAAAGPMRADPRNPRRGLVRSASGVEARHRRERSGGGSSSGSAAGAGMGWQQGGMGWGENGGAVEKEAGDPRRVLVRASSGVDPRHRRQRSSGSGSTGTAGSLLSTFLSRPGGAVDAGGAADRDAGEGRAAASKVGAFGLVRMATMERRRAKGRSQSVVDEKMAQSPFQDLSWD